MKQAYYWRDLPEAAKNTLEWIESPFSGKKNTITIEVGEVPKFSASRNVAPKVGGKPIIVDKELFDTIKFYVQNSQEESEYPFLFNETADGKFVIWNDMPEFELTVSSAHLPGR
jgi:hypothetical protein